MKKTYYVILILAFSVIFSSPFILKHRQNSEFSEIVLGKAFELSNAQIVTNEINFWGRLADKTCDSGKLTQLANDICNTLDIEKDDTYSYQITDNRQQYSIKVSGRTEDRKFITAYIQSSGSVNGSDEDTLSITVTKDHDRTGLIEARRNVTEILRKYGITPRVSSCITGSKNGELDKKATDEICTRIFKGLGAKTVESMEDRKLISISAYSPQIEDSIKVNGKRINLNLAIRYNTYENKTYIWLATPIITIEY